MTEQPPVSVSASTNGNELRRNIRAALQHLSSLEPGSPEFTRQTEEVWNAVQETPHPVDLTALYWLLVAAPARQLSEDLHVHFIQTTMKLSDWDYIRSQFGALSLLHDRGDLEVQVDTLMLDGKDLFDEPHRGEALVKLLRTRSSTMALAKDQYFGRSGRKERVEDEEGRSRLMLNVPDDREKFQSLRSEIDQIVDELDEAFQDVREREMHPSEARMLTQTLSARAGEVFRETENLSYSHEHLDKEEQVRRDHNTLENVPEASSSRPR